MFRLFKNASSKKAGRGARKAPRLNIEHLEDRAVPAVTILDSGAGTLDAVFATNNGTLTAAQTGGAQTLSRAALQAIAANVNISVVSDAITFSSLTSPLALKAGPSFTDTFDATGGSGGALTFNNTANTITTAGGNLTLKAATGETIGSLNIGAGNYQLSTTAGTFTQVGSIQGSALSITAPGGIKVQSLIGSTITLTSTGGSIVSDPAAPAALIQSTAQLTTTAKGDITVHTLANQYSATNTSTTSGNITVNQSNAGTQTLTVIADVINDNPGGSIFLNNTGDDIVVNSGVNVKTTGNGNITLAGTGLTINGLVNSGTGITTLANSVAGTMIDLGTKTAGKLSLTQAELNNVTAGVLRIGNTATPAITPPAGLPITQPLSGAFVVSTAITQPASVSKALTLSSGGAMTETAGATGGSIIATNLRLSGTGPITLDQSTAPTNNVTNLVADLTAATPAGALLFSNGTNLLTVGANIDGVTGLSSNNGDITLVADSVTPLGNPIRAATAGGTAQNGGAVSFIPFTAAANIFVGGGMGAGLDISDATLGLITAKAVRIGAVAAVVPSYPATTGAIAVDGNITGHGGGSATSGFDTLHLRTANTTGAAVTEGAFTIQASKFAVESVGTVNLPNGNSFASLAGSVTGTAPNTLTINDTTTVQIATVDGVAGLMTSNTNAGDYISLTDGGSITQATGANIAGPQLQIIDTGGAGSAVTLTNVGNSVGTLAADLTGTASGVPFSFTNAGPLTVGTVAATTTTNGITTNNGNIAVNTVNGTLTVSQAVNAGSGTASLTAGSTGAGAGPFTGNNLAINAAVTGTGGVVLKADNMAINAGVNAGTALAQLLPFQAATKIDLGGADVSGPPNTLGLTIGEINNITAGRIQVGAATSSTPYTVPVTFFNTGNVTISAAIFPTNALALSIFTGGQIIEGAGGSIFLLAPANLSLVAGAGVGTSLAPIITQVSTLQGLSNTGGFFVVDSIPLTIGGPDTTLVGVSVGGGDIAITDFLGSITVAQNVADTGGGNITLTAVGSISNITVNSGVTISATGGSGTVSLLADNNVTLSGRVSAVGSGTVTIFADHDADGVGDFVSNAGGKVSSAGGAIVIHGENVTVGDTVTSSAGGSITLDSTLAVIGGGNMFINAAVGSSGGNGNIVLRSDGNITNTAAVSTTGLGVITADADFHAAHGTGTGDFNDNAGSSLTTAGGNITITADDMSFSSGGTVTTTAASNTNVVFLFTRFLTEIITTVAADTNLANALELTNADLGVFKTGVLHIGSAATNTGGIVLAAPVTLTNTPTLSLETGGAGPAPAGAITSTVAAGTNAIKVNNLALRAAQGIGTLANPITTNVSALAFNNTVSGQVDVTNNSGAVTTPLTVGTVDQLMLSTNTSGQPTNITTNRGLVIAQNVISGGTATFTATGTNDPLTHFDSITINSGDTVTVSGSGNTLNLNAGDNVTISGSAIAAGTLNVNAGVLPNSNADADGDMFGTFTITGPISAPNVNLRAWSDVALPIPPLNLPGTALYIQSVTGGISDPDVGGTEAVNLTAMNITLKASTGIGVTGANGAIDIQVGVGTLPGGGTTQTNLGVLAATTVTGGIAIDNGDTTPTTLNIGDQTVGPNTVQGITVTGGPLGDITLNNNGTISVITTGDSITGPTAVTVNANGGTSNLVVGNGQIIKSTGAGPAPVTANAGQDVLLGDNNGFGDVEATNGAVAVTGGRNVTLDNDAIISDLGGSANVNVTATTGNVSLNQNFGTGANIRNAGTGLVNITTGPGPAPTTGLFTLNSGAGGGVYGAGGAITITADDVNIVAPAVISGTTGVVTIKQKTPTEGIDLGLVGPGGGVLALSQAEIAQITTSNFLVIGSNSNTGTINVSQPIDTTATAPNVDLKTAGAITSTVAGGTTALTMSKLALEAVTGIGVANPIATSVSNLEAQTTTGGIFVANTGAVLTIGNVLPTLSGVQASTSGDVKITNDNTIDINQASTEGVFTKNGNVVVTASGATSDVLTANNPTTPKSIESASGNVFVTAGEDVLLGTAAATGDVRANGNITLSAGRNITVNGGTLVSINGSTIGAITGTAGTSPGSTGNITVTGTGSQLKTNGGPITLTTGQSTGAGSGLLTLDSSAATGTLVSGNGAINLNDDRLNITANGSVKAGTGILTIKQVSAGWNIDIGSTVDTTAGTLEISNAEFGRMFASVIRVGDPTNTGNISLTGGAGANPVVNVAAANTSTLTLQTAGGILDGTPPASDPAAALVVTNLLLSAGLGIGSLDDLNVDVTGQLAATNSTSGNIQVADPNDLTVGSVDGVNGVTNLTPGGAIVLTAGFDGTSGNLLITHTTTAPTPDVSAATNGFITLRAAQVVTLSNNAIVESPSGDILVQSNNGVASGTSNIILNAGSLLKTSGNLTVDANPDGDNLGGGIVYTTTTQFAGSTSPGFATPTNEANNVTLRTGAANLTIDNLFAANDVSITTLSNILDDSNDATRIRAGHDIHLTSGGLIGGTPATPTPISPTDILSADNLPPAGSPTANFQAALDVAYGHDIFLTQVNTLGNISIRKIESGLATSTVILNGPLVNSGNQLAIISSGGPLTVDNGFIDTSGNLFLATTGGNSITINQAAGVTNTDPNATTDLMASGTAAASIVGNAANTIAEVSGNSIGLFTSGGSIGTGTGPLALKINSNAVTGRFDGFTNGGGLGSGNAFITDTQNGIRVGQFTAGTGNVTLVSQGNIDPVNGSSIVALTPNDDVPEIIGNVVTLNATATPSVGTHGQIGTPPSGGQAGFFEVAAQVLNATTQQSNMWLSEIGSGQIGQITVGAGAAANVTAFLRVRNGGTVTNQTAGSPSVIAPVVNLTNADAVSGTGNSGNFGTSTASPLEINTAVLNANLLGTSGNLFVKNENGTYSPGALTVQKGATTSGDIGIEVAGAGQNLTVGNASSTTPVISTGGTTAATGTVTLKAPGSITDNTAGLTDVAGFLLSATAGTGVGTAATPLRTAVGTLAASGGTGGVFDTNAGNLSLGPVTTTGMDVQVTTTAGTTPGALSVDQSVMSAAQVLLTGATSVAVNAAITGATNVQLTANNGALTTAATGPVTATAGSVTATSTGGGITLGGTVNAGTTVTANAGTTLAVNNTLTGAGNVQLTAGNGALTTTGNVKSTGGSVTATSTGGGITLGGTVNAGTSVTANAGTTLAVNAAITGATNVQLTTGNGAITTAAATGNITATAGSVTVTATGGGITFGGNVTDGTGVTATTTSIGTPGDDITVAPTSTIMAAANNPVSLLSGNNITVGGTITTSGTGVITLTGDNNNPTPAVGTTIAVAPTAALNSPNTVQVNGSSVADTFKIAPQLTGTGAKINVTGGLPTTIPGDSLLVDTTGGATGTVLTPMGTGAGTYSFTNRQPISFTGIENPTTASVTVVATTPSAQPGTNGVFTLTRTGDTTGALTVSYTMSGTAINGTDYQMLSGTTMFAAGSANAVILIVVLDNPSATPPETATLAVTPAQGYVVGGAASDTVTITGNNVSPPPATSASAPAPAPSPVITGITLFNGFVVLFGQGGQPKSLIPAPPGTKAFFTDTNGDGHPDVVVFFSTGGFLVINGLTGGIMAIGDKAGDIFLFSDAGNLTKAIFHTGQVITFS
jgi:hypothetical protein